MGELYNKKIKTALLVLALLAILGSAGFYLWKNLTQPRDPAKELEKAMSVLPAEAKELLNTPDGETLNVQTDAEVFLSKLELPAREASAVADAGGPEAEEPKEDKDLPEGLPGQLTAAANELAVKTVFDSSEDNVRQIIFFKNGKDDTSFKVNLENSAGYRHGVYQTEKGDSKIYLGANDIITYTQNKTEDGEQKIELKELIYVQKPNQDNQSHYAWNFSGASDNSKITLEKQPDGSVNVYQEMQIAGVDPSDTQKQQHIMDVVRQALQGAEIQGRTQIAVIQPAFYLTKDGTRKDIEYQVSETTLTLDIQENSNAYPLLIDPTMNWLQWLGGIAGANESIQAVAVDGEEIYAGGSTDAIYSFSSATYTGGSFSGGSEGFVVELQDNPSSAPTLNWLQWLGGISSDSVDALAVNGDEIYAGGQSWSATSFETPTYTGGTHSGLYEGFVVELGDIADSAPTLNWRQWLGGTGYDYVEALAVNGDEIYAGGYAGSATSFETPTYTGGTHSGSYEGFVAELADNAGAAPAFNWLQWLGGTGYDYVEALAVNGDEIYAGGYAGSATSFETPTYTGGTYSGNTDGLVVELQDNPSSAPTLNWLQWLGGDSDDDVYAIAVNGDEIYAGGYAYSVTSWESPTYTGGTHSGSYEGFVAELADNAGAAPAFNWLQWLGGTSTDYVYALAVNGEEIYAGGYTWAVTSWETATYTGGSFSDGGESFVAELGDITDSAPTFNWLQWLGGTGSNRVNTLAVNGDEIYAGGYTSSINSFETPTYTGGTFFYGGNEGFVAELVDIVDSAPTFNWLQWLGGLVDANDYIQAIAVDGEEIYAGGYTDAYASFSSATYTGGTHSGDNEGFVVELADVADSAPTLNWLQWLGGTNSDYVNTLAVNGDEIYAGGYTWAVTSWETATYTGGSFSGDGESFVVELADNPSSAPTLNWLQWLGGTDNDYVQALSVNGDEIYAGGYAGNATSWESAAYTGGAHSGLYEGFVVELQDNPSSAPTFNWLQWLGGTGSDYVYALAVNGDEIYAGGYASSLNSFETATYTGGTLSGIEGFVVELADVADSAPTLNWLQWLGGTGSDYVQALSVNGDEIYVGGYADNATSWETRTYTGGTHSGSNEGFVVELGDIADSAPAFNWLQWLGGTGNDRVNALAVNGDEIYTGGYAGNSTSFETATYTGGTLSGIEGFVVELADNPSSAPTLNWLQWLGGTSDDYVQALSVNGDEIYAGGYTLAVTSWEAVNSTGGSYTGSNEVTLIEILDIMPTKSLIRGGVKFKGGVEIK